MKIVFVSIGMASTVNLSLELCRRLVAAGHEVVYVSHVDIEKAVRANGFDFVRLSADDEMKHRHADAPLAWRDLRAPKRFVDRLRARRRLRRESIANDEVVRVIEALQPDRIVLDVELHHAMLKLRRLSIPMVLIMGFFSVARHADVPPLHTTLFPEAGRRRLRRAWQRLRLETWHFEWRQRLARWRKCDFHPPVVYDTFDIDDLRAVAKTWRVSLAREVSRREWLRPYAYRRLPVLCLQAREMDWPVEPPRNLHYVGAMVHPQRIDTAIDEQARARWLAYVEARDSSRPLIYASLGTFWSADIAFLRRVIDVFAHRSDWDLVLGLGGTLEPGALEPIPENALVLRWAPQLEVLARADAAITHGGVASINECLRLAVPMVVYSTGFVEQPGNAARVAHAGVGIAADKDRDNTADLERNLSRILTEPTIRERIEAMRKHLLAYEQAATAVKRIEAAEVVP
ncbi:MAG: nucleotide disphospho-sugar-binding domain-containing protein [Acidobacteriota bacterium]